MSRTDALLHDVATRVADGQIIDWDEAARMADGEGQLRAIRQLRELEGLAHVHRNAPLPEPFESARAKSHAPEDLERIGPYRILQKLGEGGMGEVYEAEQLEPVRRRVALKLIKAGMASRQVVTRFESERQALAVMSHPNIAQVFDAGVSERGRSYFAMEYVKGESIIDYCDRRRLSTRERLELFLEVCEGVQHAHQKGIIHRDLKPSNVLVQVGEDRPIPKIIDFGVAKATQQPLTEKTLLTQMGVLVGTPGYMSPEQAAMGALDIDTRADVYSLGVLLYELLCGAPPFELKLLEQAGFDELRRKIREDQPLRPSARLATLGDEISTKSAVMRRTDPRSLRRLLRGDLDWITMKALEKERKRRYGSPGELAADILRHLDHEPVLAGPPSVTYRLGKFVRRHWVGVAAAGLFLLTLVLGLAGTTYGLVRAGQAEVEARQEAAAAEQVSKFLVGLFKVSDPEKSHGASITAREILERGASDLLATLDSQPRIQTRLMGTMGSVYRNLGLLRKAEPLLERAVERTKELLGADHPDTLDSMDRLVVLHKDSGKYDEAEPLGLATVEAGRRVFGEDDPRTLEFMNNLAVVYYYQSRYDEAERLCLETLDARRRVLGESHSQTNDTKVWLGATYFRQGRYDEAGALNREAYEFRRRKLGDDHPDTLWSLENLAAVPFVLGRYEEAKPLFLKSLRTRRRVLGDDHWQTTDSMNNLGLLYVSQGRYEEARALYLESLEARRRQLGENHPRTANSKVKLANLYAAQGRHDEAERWYLEALQIQRRVLGDDHHYTLGTLSDVARLYAEQGRHAEAEPLYREALEGMRRRLGEDHELTLHSKERLAEVYWQLGRRELARQLVTDVLSALGKQIERARSDSVSGQRYAWLALTCEPSELREPARALEVALKVNEATGFENAQYLQTLALAYHRTGHAARAVETQKKAISRLPTGAARNRALFEKRLAEFEAVPISGIGSTAGRSTS